MLSKMIANEYIVTWTCIESTDL